MTRTAPLELATVDALKVDAWAVFVHPDERPLQGLGGLLDWRLTGRLSRALADGLVVGTPDDALLVTTGGLVPGGRIFLFGTGAPGRGGDSISAASEVAARFAPAAERAASALKRAKVGPVAVGLPDGVPATTALPLLRNALETAGLDATIVG